MLVRNACYDYTFKLGDSKAVTTDNMKILGVVLDQRLTYKDQFTEQIKKACAKASVLRRLRKFIPQDIMIRLYKAYILPHLENCGPLLIGIGTSQKTGGY